MLHVSQLAEPGAVDANAAAALAAGYARHHAGRWEAAHSEDVEAHADDDDSYYTR